MGRFLKLGQPLTGLLGPGAGIAAGVLGPLTQGVDDLVELLEGKISGTDGAKQRVLESSMVGAFEGAFFSAMSILSIQLSSEDSSKILIAGSADRDSARPASTDRP